MRREILLPSSPRDGTGLEKLESGERLDEKQGWCPKGIGRGRGELRVKEKDYENMVAALKVFQINPDEMALGQPLIVRSPIAGEVVKDRIVIGQYMKEDAEPVAVIADLSKVWVVAHVKRRI